MSRYSTSRPSPSWSPVAGHPWPWADTVRELEPDSSLSDGPLRAAPAPKVNEANVSNPADEKEKGGRKLRPARRPRLPPGMSTQQSPTRPGPCYQHVRVLLHRPRFRVNSSLPTNERCDKHEGVRVASSLTMSTENSYSIRNVSCNGSEAIARQRPTATNSLAHTST